MLRVGVQQEKLIRHLLYSRLLHYVYMYLLQYLSVWKQLQ